MNRRNRLRKKRDRAIKRLATLEAQRAAGDETEAAKIAVCHGFVKKTSVLVSKAELELELQRLLRENGCCFVHDYPNWE